MNAPVAVRADDLAVKAEDVLAEAAPVPDCRVICAHDSPGLLTPDSLCPDVPAVEGRDVAATVKAGTHGSAGGRDFSEGHDDDDQRKDPKMPACLRSRTASCISPFSPIQPRH